VLKYTAQLKLGGKIAQIGSRLVEGATRKLADEFFAKFATTLDQAATKVTPVESAAKFKFAISPKWIVVTVLAAGAAFVSFLAKRR
jgi:Carbon monoxide dehydrogenase subunit G (CoxG)